MKIAGFLVFCFLTVRLSSAQITAPEDLERTTNAQLRNVIFILSDDHRYDFMGFTGKVPWLETPNMDRLAKEGAYFPNTFVTNANSTQANHGSSL